MCADWVREEDPPNYTSDQLSIAHVKDRQVGVAVSSLLGEYYKDVSQCGMGAQYL